MKTGKIFERSFGFAKCLFQRSKSGELEASTIEVEKHQANVYGQRLKVNFKVHQRWGGLHLQGTFLMMEILG